MIRSAHRYKALDETAVFGYCCRHEFPGEFINLKHGERLVYYLLSEILLAGRLFHKLCRNSKIKFMFLTIILYQAHLLNYYYTSVQASLWCLDSRKDCGKDAI